MREVGKSRLKLSGYKNQGTHTDSHIGPHHKTFFVF
jgi:hypothetical protein